MLASRYSPWVRIVWFGLGGAFITAAFYAVVAAAFGFAAALANQPVAQWQALGIEKYALWISVLSYPPLLGWVIYCRHFLDRRSVRSLGLRLPQAGRLFFLGALGGALAVAWLFGALWVCGSLSFGGTSPEAFERTAAQIALNLLAHAAAFVAVGFMEELIFRGYLLHNLAARWPGASSAPRNPAPYMNGGAPAVPALRWAIWAQAIAFALVHVSNAALASGDADARARALGDAARAMPTLVLVGGLFALMWAKSGSLWPSVGFHAAWNFALGCLFSLPVSGIQTFRLFDFAAVGTPWISGGSFGAEGSVLAWPILGAAWWLLSRLPDHPQVARDLALLDPTHPTVISEAQLSSAIDPPAAPAAPRVQDEPAEPEAETESRFRTSMRRRGEEQAPTSFPILGQLPRSEAGADWTPALVADPPPSAPEAGFSADVVPFAPPAPAAASASPFAPGPIGKARAEAASTSPAPPTGFAWEFQPLPAPPAATIESAPATPEYAPAQVLEPAPAPQVLAPAVAAPQVLAAAPEPQQQNLAADIDSPPASIENSAAPSPLEPTTVDATAADAPTETTPVEAPPAEAPRPRRPAPRW